MLRRPVELAAVTGRVCGTRINRKAAQVYQDFLAARIEELRGMEQGLLNRISHFPFPKVTDRCEIPPRHKTDHLPDIHARIMRKNI